MPSSSLVAPGARRLAALRGRILVSPLSTAAAAAPAPSPKAPRVALLFPGQGAQRPGMGKDLADAFPQARHAFEEVDEALKERLSRTMFTGAMADLSRTAVTQPALLAHSIAVFRVLEAELGDALLQSTCCVAGHSVGEYAALVAAGSLSLADAARLLRLRGESMQAAADAAAKGQSDVFGMEALLMRPPAAPPAATAAVPSSPLSPLLAAAAELERRCEAVRSGASPSPSPMLTVSVAGVNSPQQIVLSGHSRAIQAVLSGGTAASVGVKRAVKLPVSAPFHCAVMAPAEETVRAALTGDAAAAASVPVLAPRVPWLSNVDAKPHASAEDVRRLLPNGITRPVRWAESAYAAYDAMGARVFVEMGADSTLAGLVRQVLMSVPASSAATAGGGGAADVRSAGEAGDVAECLKHLARELEK